MVSTAATDMKEMAIVSFAAFEVWSSPFFGEEVSTYVCVCVIL